VTARSRSVSHSASAARACTRERSIGSRNVRASSASVLTSETAVTRRISAIGSASAAAAAGFFAAGFADFAGCVCGGGCCASVCAGETTAQSATANRETLFDITFLRTDLTLARFGRGRAGRAPPAHVDSFFSGR
jgi:hypothetical protein